MSLQAKEYPFVAIYPSTPYVGANDISITTNGYLKLNLPPSATGAAKFRTIGLINDVVPGTLVKIGYSDEVASANTIVFPTSSSGTQPVAGNTYAFKMTFDFPIFSSPSSSVSNPTGGAPNYENTAYFSYTATSADTTWTILAGNFLTVINKKASEYGTFTCASSGTTTITLTFTGVLGVNAGVQRLVRALDPTSSLTYANTIAGNPQRYGSAQLNAKGIVSTTNNVVINFTESYYDLVYFQIKVPQGNDMGGEVKLVEDVYLYVSNPSKTGGGTTFTGLLYSTILAGVTYP